MSGTKKIIILALLIAMEIVLTRFLSMQVTPAMRLSLGFVPIAIMAMLFGPLYAGVGAAAADFLGVMLFSSLGFFPGFTLTAFLVGMVYGFFLRNEAVPFWKIIAAAAIVTICLNLLLDTFWLSIIITSRGYFALLPERIIRTAIMLPVQVVCLKFVTSERFRGIIDR